MVGKSVSLMAASVVTCGMLALPASSSAQGYRYDDRASVSVRCAPGQRAVLDQRGSRVVARCVGSGRVVNSGYGRARYGSRASYNSYAPARQRVYYERAPRRSKAKSALMIAGSAASGAGIGGALRGKKGALVGAAIGGGAASIYEAAKRR
jgi:hypothetical protein